MRPLILPIVLLSVFLCGSTDVRAVDRPPNVILILVDDLGWMDLSVQGSDFFRTPNIDRLAETSMRFTDSYSASAVCSPTRAAIMTGKNPARTGVTDWIRARFQRSGKAPDANPSEYVSNGDRPLATPPNPYWLELSQITLAEALNAAGYTTMHIGKWHLGDPPQFPEHQGFDYNFLGCDLGQPPSYHAPYKHNRYDFDPPIEPLSDDEYLTDREAIEAVEFIRKHQDEPFFLHMAHYAVHTPIEAKQSLLDRYEKRKDGKGQDNAAYATMVQTVDDATGRILDTLDQLNLSDDTLIIFTSDNGGLDRNGNPTDNAPLRSGKGYAYEGGIRVPLIIRYPGVTMPGSVSDQPVISHDLFATIAHIADAALPHGHVRDGVNLLPVLRGETLPERNLMWHFPHYRHGPGHDPYSIIRSGDYKLIRFYDPAKVELYNLADDLSEQNDLSQKLPDKVATLNRKLDTMLERTSAKMPRRK